MKELDELEVKLKNHSFEYEKADDYILVKSINPEGFDVSIKKTNSDYVVTFGHWHDHFHDVREALNYLVFGLSTNCRLKIMYAGKVPYKTIVQAKSFGTSHWIDRNIIGLMIYPFWLKKTEVYKQNSFVLKDSIPD